MRYLYCTLALVVTILTTGCTASQSYRPDNVPGNPVAKLVRDAALWGESNSRISVSDDGTRILAIDRRGAHIASEDRRIANIEAVTVASINTDGSVIGYVSRDDRVVYVSKADGEQLARIEHASKVYGIWFCRYGERLYVLAGTSLAFHSARDGSRLGTMAERCAGFGVSTNGEVLTIHESVDGADYTTRALSASDHSELYRCTYSRADGSLQGDSFVSDDGKMLLLNYLRPSAELYEFAHELWSMEAGTLAVSGNGRARMCPLGRRLAVPDGEERISLWDLTTMKQVAALDHSRQVFDMAFSRDGTLFATAGNHRLIRLWRSEDGVRLSTIDGPWGWVTALAFGADSQSGAPYLVSAHTTNKPSNTIGDGVRVWYFPRAAAVPSMVDGMERDAESPDGEPDKTGPANDTSDDAIRKFLGNQAK